MLNGFPLFTFFLEYFFDIWYFRAHEGLRRMTRGRGDAREDVLDDDLVMFSNNATMMVCYIHHGETRHIGNLDAGARILRMSDAARRDFDVLSKFFFLVFYQRFS